MGQQMFKGKEGLSTVLGKYNKILLVHGKSFEHCPIKTIFQSVQTVDFTEFAPNPLYEDVCKGVELYNREKCDAVAAVGGGSAIDVAKCIKLFCKMDKSFNYLQQEKTDTGIPLIVVPTTAGTGSESTQHAVIYYEGEKQSLSHPSIVPDYVFLISSLLNGLPKYQKKCTMMDALCQAIESWWSVNSTDESKDYSKKAIEEIKENWKEYIIQDTDGAAERILDASNYAGRAINITTTTAAHAMSYKITSLYKLPHGHAVAICLPKVWEYMLEHMNYCSDERGAEYLKCTLNQIEDVITLDYFKLMVKELGLESPAAIEKEQELDILAQSVNPARLKNNPVGLNTKTLKEMYRRIVK